MAFILILLFLLFFPEKAFGEMPESFQKKKLELLTKIIQAGVNEKFARRILSDKRLTYYNFFEKSSGIMNKIDPTHGIFEIDSIKKGGRVMKAKKNILNKVYERYGVQSEYLVSFYWVESRLGDNVGRYLVINSLFTWVLSNTRRANWAEKELITFIKICDEQKFDPFSIRGSWAGAFGKTQFIPSSYANFAVDGNGDGKIDLFNFEDAMFSTGNYLHCHGWQENDLKKIRKAIYAYNHNMHYVNIVEIYASFVKYSNIICEGD
jgi:membrane-bound lytic murein transglycosylase B